MDFNILGYILIALIAIICIRVYQSSDSFQLKCIVSEVDGNKYDLIHVEAKERLYMADIILQFKKKRKVELGVTAEVDVKATSEDFDNSGKSPNITSYGRIRTA